MLSIREIMDVEVDPAADALWASVGTTINAAGRIDREPRTDKEWFALRRSAIMLLEACNRIKNPGRRIAPDHKVYAHEASTPFLQKRLDASRTEFLAFAASLEAMGVKALRAIDSRDAARLLDVGSDIDEACEACHRVFWYPADPGLKD